MSEIEEPPAKVLKIDSVDSESTKHTAPDMSLLETSTEQEEVHEEWLSEGILTDDDYNTASQEDEDHTDSQLGSQIDPEEEHLDTSLESTTNETKQIHNDIQTVLDNLHKSIEEDDQVAVENGTGNALENAENVTEKVANNEVLENEKNSLQIADTNQDMSDSEVLAQIQPVVQDEHDIALNEPTTAQNEPEIALNVPEIEQNVSEIEQNEPEKPQNEQEIAQNELETAQNVPEIEQNEQENVDKPQMLENLLFTLENNDKTDDSEINTTAVLMDSQVKILSSKIFLADSTKTVEQNIEETMKHLDGSKEDMNSDDFNDLLLKKSDTKSNEVKTKTENKKEDDGNDTDDLLRMLGEDDNKTKKLTKTVKDLRRSKRDEDSTDDDDDFVYEGPGVKKLKAAKSVIAKKQPTKAVPEDFDDEDSSDHSDDTLKRMFSKSNLGKNKGPQNVRTNPRHHKQILNVVEKTAYEKEKSTPTKQYQNNNMKYNKSILKPAVTTPKTVPTQKTGQTNKHVKIEVKKEIKTPFKPPNVTTPAPFKSAYKHDKTANDDEEYADEQFLDDDHDYDLDDDDDQIMESEGEEPSRRRQRIMRPEIMDEDVPSDAESYTEGSLYDEMPSSDSEDMDDWFTLDIRAEKAGDYLPLLGSKAKQLLQEEKDRVTARLITLKQSLTALTESGKQQADELRDATLTLAELDDMIKAS